MTAYKIKVETSDSAPPKKNSLTTSIKEIFLGAFVSQKNTTRAKGMVIAPTKIVPGKPLVLLNTVLINSRQTKVIAKTAKTRI